MAEDLRERLTNELASALADWVEQCMPIDSNDPGVIKAIVRFSEVVVADTLLPLIREHVAAEVKQARRDERERAACDLDTMQAAYSGEAEVQRGLRIGAILIRKIAEADDGTQ